MPDNFTHPLVTESFESVLKNDVAESGMEVTPLLLSWTETITVFGFMKDAVDADNTSFMLYDAYNRLQPYFAAVGLAREKIDGAYASCCTVKPSSGDNDTVNVRQVTRYIKPGLWCQIDFGCYQQTEVRTFAEDPTGWKINGNDSRVTAITFKPSDAFQQAGAANMNVHVPFVMQANVPSLLRSFRVTQYEELPPKTVSPALISGPPKPIWNNDMVWGYKEGDLLYIGCTSEPTGTPIYKRTYTFIVNQYGWHHFYGIYVWQNNLSPAYISPLDPTKISAAQGTIKGNGTAAFRMIPRGFFGQMFRHFKKPFDEFPTSVASGSPTGSGPPMDSGVIPEINAIPPEEYVPQAPISSQPGSNT